MISLFRRITIMSNFYAVRRGRTTGVFSTWKECEEQIKGFKGAIFKKFPSQLEAQAFVTVTSKSATSIISVKQKRKSSTTSSVPSDPKKVKLSEDILEAEDCDDSGDTVVYTDGSCHGNGKGDSKAGLGVYWGPGHANNLSERVEGKQSNNRAEILAVCRAIEQAKQQQLTTLQIRTDSMFLINCVLKWMPKWKRNGWILSTGKAVINREELERLDKCLQTGIKVKFVHVKAHMGNRGNEEADRLANEGARK